MLEQAGGVPYFLVSCAQVALAEQGANATTPGERTVVPATVAESIRQRVVALPEAAHGCMNYM